MTRPMTPNTAIDCTNRTGTWLPIVAVESCGSLLPGKAPMPP